MTFNVQRLPEPLLLEQAVLDPTWNMAKTIGFVIAAILVFWVFGEKMFLLGSRSVPAPTAIIYEPAASPPVAVSVPVPASAVPAMQEMTPEELDRRHSELLRRQD